MAHTFADTSFSVYLTNVLHFAGCSGLGWITQRSFEISTPLLGFSQHSHSSCHEASSSVWN